MARLSSGRCLLLPIISLSCGVLSHGFPCQRRLDHATADALPPPGNHLHCVVFSQAGPPKPGREFSLQPYPEVSVHRTRTATYLPGTSFPLNPRPMYVDDPAEYFPEVLWFATSAWFSAVLIILVQSIWNGDQRLYLLPKSIRNQPRLGLPRESSVCAYIMDDGMP